MFLFWKKKTNQTEEMQGINNFNDTLNVLLEIDGYVSRKEYKFLIDDYKKTYDSLKAIERSDLLKEFSKKNRINISVVSEFFEKYEKLDSIIKNRNDEYIIKALNKEKFYLDNVLKDVDSKIVLDTDQRKAVLSDEDYSLVIAGAGAGKTTTVAAKVKYLVDRKNIDPKQILIISFTNKAVGELKERIQRDLKIDCPIATFHSAGNAILRKNTDEKLNIVEGSFLYNTIRDYILYKMKDKKLSDNLVLFFGSYFEPPCDDFDKLKYQNHMITADFTTLKSNLNEYSYCFTDKTSNKKITINNETVKSFDEVKIANFLYLNGIDYEYEPAYPYYIFMARKRYTPDFVIRQNGKVIYLEHFGITESGENNRYTPEELARYKKHINDKIEIHRKHNTELIYTFSKYNDGKPVTDHLKQLLDAKGIKLNAVPSEEVIGKLRNIQENKYVSRMVYLICDFINNFKVNGYTEDKFYEFLRTTKSERTKLFLEICRECYLEYQRTLARNNAVDFQDMINDAARALREVASLKTKLDFKYIIIDEYQDISRQRFDMAKELSKVTDAKIIAVGDDWQSIFAFSGSDVTLFTNFCNIMGYGKELKITRTYRNAQEVIDIAGGFIQKNDNQIKKSLISPKHIKDPVVIVSYDDSKKKYNETAKESGPIYKMAVALENIIGKIVSEQGDKSNILLIGRYNYDGEMITRSGKFIYNNYGNKVVCKKYPGVDITFLTAHSSKGLGYDNVIIINAKDAVYGFPSKIEDDPVMKLVIKQNEEIEYAEERRLFYVALTRTKNRVYIVAPEKHPSQFVLEIKKDYKNVVLDGELNPEGKQLITNKTCPICGYPLQMRYDKANSMRLWMCTNEPELCGFTSNNLSGGKMSIQKCPDCLDGYLIVKTKNGHCFLGCTNYKSDGTGCNTTVSQYDYNDFISKEEVVEFETLHGETKSNDDNDNNKQKTPENLYDKTNGTHSQHKEIENTTKPVINEPQIVEDRTEETIEEEKTKIEGLAIDEETKKVVLDNIKIILDTYRDISKKRAFGVATLAAVLCGRETEKLKKYEFDKLKNYGIYNKYTSTILSEVITSLIKENVFSLREGKYPILTITKDKSLDTISNETLLKINEYMLHEKKPKVKKVTSKKVDFIYDEKLEKIISEDGEILTDEKLLKELKVLRNKISDESNAVLYMIATNMLLAQLATFKPVEKEEFLKLKGIRERWYERYGEQFSNTIKNYKDNE